MNENLLKKLRTLELISESQYTEILEKLLNQKIPLPQILLETGLFDQERLAATVKCLSETPVIELEDFNIDYSLFGLLSDDIIKKYKIIPLFKIRDTLTVAISNPTDVTAIYEAEKYTGISIDIVLSPPKHIARAIERYLGEGQEIEGVDDLIEVSDTERTDDAEDIIDINELQKIAKEAPLVRLVNIIIFQAAQEGVSDIHIEPEKSTLKIRYRIDGVLQEVRTLPRQMKAPVIARIKIMSHLDIIEKRKPQDGRISMKFKDLKDVDLRVSTFPTTNGEKVVIRILDKSKGIPGLDKIGLTEEMLVQFRELISKPNGIILVTGPTGSGKTSTLYSALNEINTVSSNIVTLEDPVEFEIEGLNQGNINTRVGFTFASGLRSILRQDPNVIFVGEVRDVETAQISIRASLTGHLVFSSLHTNDAPSTIARLIDMGVEPFLLASSIRGILAQRLVRVNCPDCAEEYTPPQEVLERLHITPRKDSVFLRGKGCAHCRKTGYKGRTGIFELLIINDPIKEAIIKQGSPTTLRDIALANNMTIIQQHGIAKALAGTTTLEEVLRVTQEE
ncbi:MAG: Flp pilus assembly complex ATPase component TadA [Candidatus Omnitrophica bacterium]|nr:Flp pilus assembly complex ATPase component TadA [Candidatus Omnitrophota bacterium]